MFKRFQKVIGSLLLVGGVLWAIIRFLADIDFIITRAQDPGWLGKMLATVLALTSGETLLITAAMMVLGFILLYWGLSRKVPPTTEDGPPPQPLKRVPSPRAPARQEGQTEPISEPSRPVRSGPTYDEGPDISVWDAFQRIADPNKSVKFVHEIQDFRQKAFKGEIDLWGKESPSGVRKKLPRGYWEFYTINPDSLFRKGSHGATTVLAQTVRSVSDPKMIQLETVWHQVERHFFASPDAQISEGAADTTNKRQMVPLLDALRWIIDNSGWEPGHGPDSNLDLAAIEVRQAARDSEVTIRGRREIERHMPGGVFDQTWENIEPDYWRTHDIDVGGIMTGGYAHQETRVISPGDIRSKSMPHYAMLRIYKHEMEARWPVANT